MPHVLGLDCGGSSTRAVLVLQGKAVWTGAAGPANLSTSPEEAFRESILTATEGCPTPLAVCGAFAGLMTPEQQQRAEQFLGNLFPEASVTAVPDFEAALVACGEGIDVCVVAGTGSLVCSPAGNGALYKSGGKGFILGDEGSGFQYGKDALLHFLEGPPDDVSSDLREAVVREFGTDRRGGVIAALYAASDAPKRLASLIDAFAKDAERGSIYALKSLRIQCGKLAHVVSQHLRQYHPDMKTVKIGCQGGLWFSPVFRDTFTQQLVFWCRVDEVEVDFDPPAPVFGAAEIAGRLLQ